MKRYSRFRAVATIGLIAAATSAPADVKLPAIFSDHMVLQRDAAVPVWGWAAPGEQVTVTISNQTKTATPGGDGKWMVKLGALGAGGPFTLAVKGRNSLTVKDVLAGEVWVGSGQSNMALMVSAANNYEQEKAAANLPQIRMFSVAANLKPQPQNDCEGEWVVCSPETVGRFSATAYFFGRELHKRLGAPVGLIKSCVGGTPIESWIDAGAQRRSPDLKGFLAPLDKAVAQFDPAEAKAKYEKDLEKWKEAVAKAKAAKQPLTRKPRDPVDQFSRKHDIGGLFNGMIAPLIPYGIRGAIWYQGEANAYPDKAPYYQAQLELLVKDWRARWGQQDFPFAWVQLPNFTREGDAWMRVREAMLKALEVPNTGMAIAIDIGDPKNIHPKNKQEIGRRLAMWALGTAYGQKVATSGPLPAGHRIEGNEAAVSFTHTDGGLVVKGGEVKGFMLAGADKKWVKANAKIDKDTVVVSSPDVKAPVAVRYAWADNPDCNLANGAGLPASPFRTDDWADAAPAARKPR